MEISEKDKGLFSRMTYPLVSVTFLRSMGLTRR